MSSPPKKMRKSAAGGGGGVGVGGSGGSGGDGAANTSANDSVVGAAPTNAEPVANDNNDVEMDDDLDPAAMYEDEEGMSQTNISTNSIRFELNFIYLDPNRWLSCRRYLHSATHQTVLFQ